MRLRDVPGWLWPGGLLLAAAVTAAGRLEPGLLEDLRRVYPYGVLAVAALIGLRMRRGRLVQAVGAVVLGDWLLSGVAPPGSLARVAGPAVGVLLPLNLAAVAWLRERGLLTRWGLARLALLPAQVWLVRWGTLRGWIGTELLRTPIPGWQWGAVGALPPLALAAFALSLALVGIRVLRGGRRIDRGLFWALGAALYGLGFVPLAAGRSFLLASAGLILVVSALEESLRLAFQDEGTGLPARRALNEALARLGSRYALAMVDIDHFKRFNDRYGHEAGDQVLRMVAARLRAVSGGGRAYRYGGEEFTLLFPGRTLEQARPHVERLRKEIAGSSFVIRGRRRPRKKPAKPRPPRTTRQRVRVKVSIGLAEPTDRHPTPEEVMKAADKALYRAKRAGRNRVVG